MACTDSSFPSRKELLHSPYAISGEHHISSGLSSVDDRSYLISMQITIWRM
ncbi:MAG: hypothetical protein ACXAE3_11800 [Candidatus Kariarchaeaceae archaeon]